MTNKASEYRKRVLELERFGHDLSSDEFNVHEAIQLIKANRFGSVFCQNGTSGWFVHNNSIIMDCNSTYYDGNRKYNGRWLLRVGYSFGHDLYTVTMYDHNNEIIYDQAEVFYDDLNDLLILAYDLALNKHNNGFCILPGGH